MSGEGRESDHLACGCRVVPMPDGSNAFVMLGGPDRRIVVNGETILFEVHPYCGPMHLKRDGSVRDLGPRHQVWRIVSLWYRQGKVIGDDGLCQWTEPKPPVLKHLGGRNYWVVEPGDDDWDALGNKKVHNPYALARANRHQSEEPTP